MSNFIVNTDIPNIRVVVRDGDNYNVNIIRGTTTTLQSGSYISVADTAQFATSASFAQTASYALNTQGSGFPFSGSAVITGSLLVIPTGNVGGVTASLLGTASIAENITIISAGIYETGSDSPIIPTPEGGLSYITSASYALTASYALNGGGSSTNGTVSSSQQILNYNIFATTGSNTFVGNQIVNGFIESQYNGVTQGSLGNGPSGFSLSGEDDKTFGIILSDSVTGPVSWTFLPNGELGVPGNVNGAPNLATTGSNTFVGDQIISGSIVLEDSSSINAGWAYDYNTSGSLAWNNRQLYDSLERTSVNWETRQLLDDAGNSSVLTWADGVREFFGTSSLAVSASWAPTANGVYSSSAQISQSGFVSSSTINTIQTITSASYAAITPVSGTLYIIID